MGAGSRPCQRLDYSWSWGVVMARGSSAGRADVHGGRGSHVFGISLFNDWAPRDNIRLGIPAAEPGCSHFAAFAVVSDAGNAGPVPRLHPGGR
jgi:hypothetical protein